MTYDPIWPGVLKPFGIWQIPPPPKKSSCKWSLFDLKLTLGCSRGALEQLKRCVLSPYKRRDVTLIRLNWFVKLCGKHCQISDAKPLLDYICVDMLLI